MVRGKAPVTCVIHAHVGKGQYRTWSGDWDIAGGFKLFKTLGYWDKLVSGMRFIRSGCAGPSGLTDLHDHL